VLVYVKPHLKHDPQLAILAVDRSTIKVEQEGVFMKNVIARMRRPA
jgi:hypothetical protein